MVSSIFLKILLGKKKFPRQLSREKSLAETAEGPLRPKSLAEGRRFMAGYMRAQLPLAGHQIFRNSPEDVRRGMDWKWFVGGEVIIIIGG